RVAARRGFHAVLRPRKWSWWPGSSKGHPVECRDDRLCLSVDLLADAETGPATEPIAPLLARIAGEVAAACDQVAFDPAGEPWIGTDVHGPRKSATVSPG
ncbi:MAG: hypothetical protein AAGF44_10730, partial [Pseudomonadota bacterium]